MTVKQFLLKKFPTNEYMDCPVPKHHWEVMQEYAEAYHESVKSEPPNEPSIDLAQERIDYYENRLELMEKIAIANSEPSIQDDGKNKDLLLLQLKYERYISNLKWHIDNNKPTGKELDECSSRIADYNEVLSDLCKLEFAKPQPLQDEGLEEAANKYADSLHDKNTGSGQYRWLTAKEDFEAGAEYYKQLNK